MADYWLMEREQARQIFREWARRWEEESVGYFSEEPCTPGLLDNVILDGGFNVEELLDELGFRDSADTMKTHAG